LCRTAIMTLPDDCDDPRFGPWHPGIESQIPPGLLPLATLYCAEHAQRPLREIQELHDLTGLPLQELTVFRPERLALHEVLLRVTANISVPDGNRIEDLGINFRQITRVLLEGHVAPQMPAIVAAYETMRSVMREIVGSELARMYAAPAPSPPPAGATWWQRIVGGGAAPPAAAAIAPTAESLVAEWDARARAATDDTERAALRALSRTVSAVLVPESTSRPGWTSSRVK